MEWMLVENATDVHSIKKALCSRLHGLSVLFWCEKGLVRAALTRFVRKKGVCMAWQQWDGQVYEPPRWPCLRGDSAFDAREVVRGFLKVVGEWKKKRALPRLGELEGDLAAVERKWRRGRKWNSRGDELPAFPINMPCRLWGCPLLPEFLPPGSAMEVEDVGVEPADAVVEERLGWGN